MVPRGWSFQLKASLQRSWVQPQRPRPGCRFIVLIVPPTASCHFLCVEMRATPWWGENENYPHFSTHVASFNDDRLVDSLSLRGPVSNLLHHGAFDWIHFLFGFSFSEDDRTHNAWKGWEGWRCGQRPIFAQAPMQLNLVMIRRQIHAGVLFNRIHTNPFELDVDH